MIKQKKSELLIILALLILVAPFFLLSFFCNPSADDYSLSALVREIGFSGFFDFMFQNWSGRFTGAFFTAINPMVYNSLFIYKLIPIILLIVFFISIFYFLKSVFNMINSNRTLLLLSLILFTLYLNSMPDLAEGIYWYSSTTYHFIAGIYSLFLFTLITKIPKFKTYWEKSISIILSIALVILIVGSNEVHTFLTLEYLSIIILTKVFFKKKVGILEIILLVIIIAVSYFAMNAPGNFRRLGFLPNHFNFSYAILHSFKSTIFLVGHHIQNVPFIIVSIISLPFFSKLLLTNKVLNLKFKVNPAITIILSILIIASQYFPTYFALGSDPPWRVHNSISLVFIFLWFLNIFLTIKYLHEREIIIPATPKYLTTVLIVIAFLFAFIDFHVKDPRDGVKFRGNIANAYYDLFFVAPKYDKEIRERNIKIENDIKNGTF